MICPSCESAMHEDSSGVCACISCGARFVEPSTCGATYNSAGTMGDVSTIDKNLDISDGIINPDHYTSFKIPPNEYITANKLGWEVGNCCKYISRYHLKNGKEDLLKAAKYISLLIERKYGEKYTFTKE